MRKIVIYFIICVLAISCVQRKQATITISETNNSNIDNQFTDSNLLSLLIPYQEQIGNSLNKVIRNLEYPMEKSKPFGSLDSFFARTLFDMGEILTQDSSWSLDIALFNHGGLRASLPSGQVTVRNIFELMPFDNQLVFVELSGNEILAMQDYLIERDGEPIWGYSLTTQELNSKRVIDSDSSYWVITSDYLLNGGDKMEFLKNYKRMFETNILIRDALIKMMQMSHED